MIYTPAQGDGRVILDPGATGNVFEGGNPANGFAIGYHAVPQLSTEPLSDLRTGAGGGHTDLVANASGESAAYMFYKPAQEALMFRVRIGGESTASKGYSFFFNTDISVFGPKATDFSSVNPGFQFEVVLETNNSISLYEWGGGTSPESSITLTPESEYVQRAISEAQVNGRSSAGAFYDFYVPLSEIDNLLPGTFDASTQFRVVGGTVTRAQSGLEGTVSDLGGVNDDNYRDVNAAMIDYIRAAPVITANALTDGAAGFGGVKTATPTVRSPVSVNNTSISGTLAEADATGAVTVSVGGVSVGTADVSGGTWTLSGLDLSADADKDVTATATVPGKSPSSTSEAVPILAEGVECTVEPINAAGGGRTVDGTMTNVPAGITQASDLTIRIYNPDGTLYASTDPAQTGAVTVTSPLAVFDTATGDFTVEQSGGGNDLKSNIVSGKLITAQYAGKCESGQNTFSNTTLAITNPPTITTEPITASSGAQTIAGTSETDASVTLYQDGTQIATTTADGTGNWSTSVAGGTFEAGKIVYATALDPADDVESDRSNEVTVVEANPAQTTAPTIAGAYTTNNTAINGSTVEGGGVRIRVLVNGTPIDTTTSDAYGNWSVTGVDLTGQAGNDITARAKASGKTESVASAPVTIQSAQTPAPTLSQNGDVLRSNLDPINGSGTGTIRLYVDGEPVISGTFPFAFSDTNTDGETLGSFIEPGVEIYATAQAAGEIESPPSAETISVIQGDVRYITVDAITPSEAPGGGGETVDVRYTVLDGSFAADPNVPITFTIPTGGGTLSTTSATTDANGDVTTTYTTAAGDDGTTVRVQADDNTAGNDIAAPTSASFPVQNPPAYASGYPTTANPTTSGFDVNVQVDKDGTAYYVVVSDGSGAPTVTQIKNGTNASGTAAQAAGSGAISANTEKTFAASGLTDDTPYDVYAVVEDAAGNANRSAKVEERTLDGTAPTISNVSLGNDGSGNLAFRFDSDEPLGGSAADVAVTVDGPTSGADVYSFDRSAFSEGGSGPYTYTLSATQAYGDGDGTYTAAVDDALDPAGNDGADGSQTDTYTLDTTPPSFASGYPTTANPTTSGFDVTIQADEGGTASYVVVTDGAAAPTAAQVKNGNNASGSAAQASGTGAVTANTEKTFTASGLAGDTPYDVYAVVEDGGGNTNAPGLAEESTLDGTPPSITTVTGPSDGGYAIGDLLTVTVDYDEAVIVNESGGTPSIELDIGGTTRQATYDTGSGTTSLTFTYTLAVGDDDGDGIGFASTTIQQNGGTLKDGAGNDADRDFSGGAPNLSGVTTDGTVPVVSSITRSAPSAAETSQASVDFAVSFSESVSGIDPGDFALGSQPDGGATISSVSAPSGTSITVTVSSIAGDGTLGLDVAGTTDIQDGAGNALDPTEPSTDETYTIDNTAPVISNVALTNDGAGNLDLSFDSDEPLSSFAVTVDGPTTADVYSFTEADFSESGGTYTLTTTQAYGDGNGPYTAAVDDALDAAGNDGADGTQTDTYTLDTVAPSISNVTLGNDGSGNLDLTFESDESLGATASDIAVTVDGPTSGADVYSFDGSDFLESGSGPYTYTLTTTQAYGDGDGTYTAAVDDALDAEGNDGADGSQTDAYTLDTSAPTISNVSLTNDGSGNLDLTFESDETLAALTVTVDGPNTADAYTFDETDFGESGGTYTLTTTQAYDDGDGAYAATMDAAADADGNDGANGESDSYTLDTTPPSFAAGYPTTSNVATTGFDVDVQVGEDGTASWVVVGDGATAPSAAQIKSGNDASGSAALASGSGAVTAGVEASFAATGLSEDTPYDVYAVVEDGAGNTNAPGSADERTLDGTAPAISNVSLGNDGSGNLAFRFDSDEPLGGSAADIAVTVDGPTTADVYSFARSDFSESGSGPYTYTLSTMQAYGDGDGTYTAAVDDALDPAGNDGADGSQTDSYTLDATAPAISSVTLGNDGSDNLAFSFDSDEPLGGSAADIAVTVDGPTTADVYSFARSDFSESGSGPYTYTLSTTQAYGDGDGAYTAVVDDALDAEGNDGADGSQTDTYTLDTTAPTISNVSLANDGGDNLALSFDADESLAALTVTVDGPNTTDAYTFDETDFGESGGTYTLTTTQAYDDGDGAYTATIDAAADADGNDGANGENDSYTLDTTAPSYASGFPTADNPSTDGFDVKIQVDEAGTAAWVVVTDGAGVPTASQIQSGTNASGTAAQDAGSGAIAAGTEKTFPASGLASNTPYDVYAVVEDAAGNARVSNKAEETTLEATAPTIASGTLAGDNGHVDVSFSEGIYTGSDGTGALTTGDLAYTFSQNGGAATDISIDGVTQTDGTALAGGETTVRVQISVTGAPASGVETVAIQPADGTSIYDGAGNAMAASETTGALSLNDRRGPGSLAVDSPSALQVRAATAANSGRTTVEVGYRYTETSPDAATITLDDGAGNTAAYSIDDSGYAGDGTPTTATLDLTAPDVTTGSGLVDATTYDVQIQATDANGNANSTTSGGLLTIDNTAPGLTAATIDGEALTLDYDEALDPGSVPETGDYSVRVNGSSASLASVGVSSDKVTLTLSSAVSNGDAVEVDYTAGTAPIQDDGSENDAASLANQAVTNNTADVTAPTISNVSLGNSSGNLAFSFDSDEPLGGSAADISVTVDGPTSGADVYSFDRSDFSESGSGPYTYTLAVTQAYGDGDGTYTAAVDDALDAAGNDGADGTQTDTYTLDTAGPGVAPTLTATAVAGGDIDLSWTDVNDGTATYTLRRGTASGGPYSDVTTATDDNSARYGYTDTGLTDGTTYYYVVVPVDGTGNEGTPSNEDNATVDATAPVVSSITRSAPTAETTNQASVDFAVSFSESVSGIDPGDFALGSQPSGGAAISSVSASSGTSITVTVGSISGDGTIGLDVAGTTDIVDGAGNALDATEPSTDETYTIDNTAPVISNVSLTNDGADNLALSFDSDESLGGSGADIAVTVDGPTSGTDVYSFDGSDFSESGSGPYTYTLTTTQAYGDGNGSYTAAIDDALDAVGNDGADGSQTDAYTLDTSAPTISNVSLTNDGADNLDLTFDADETLAALTVTVDGPNTTDAYTFDETDFAESGGTYTLATTQAYDDGDGAYTATVDAAADADGNDGANGESDSYTLDTTAPVISNVSLTNDGSGNLDLTFDSDESLGTTTSDIAVTVDGPTSGVDVYSFDRSDFSESGSGPYTYTLTLTQAYDDGDGTYTAAVDDALDAAGNDGADGSQADTYTLDTTGPSGYAVTWTTSPINGDNDTAADVEITGGAAGLDYDYTITTDGGAGNVTGSGTMGAASETITDDVSSLADGTLTVAATLTDGSGNSGAPVTDDVTKDTQVPSTVAITSPADDATVQPDPTIEGSATDDGQVAAVALAIQRTSDGRYWDGSSWVGTATTVAADASDGTFDNGTENWTYAAGITGADTYQVTATATDAAGNDAASAASGFTISDPQQIALAGPATVPAGQTSSAFTLTVQDGSGTATPVTADTDVDLSSTSGGTVTFSTDPVTVPAGASSVTVTYRDTEAGDQTITATATSPADGGLSGATATAPITVTPGPADETVSTIAAADPAIEANGSSTTTITVQLADGYGNNLTSGGDNVALSTDAGSLGGVTDNGDGTYAATLTSSTTVGTATITGTVNGGAITDDATVDFTTGAAASVAIVPIASPQTAGQAFSVDLTVEDASGNPVTDYSGTLDLTLAKGGSISPTTVDVAASDNGTQTVSVTLTDTAIDEQVTATDDTDGSITGTSNRFDVGAGAISATQSVVAASPSTVTADGADASTLTIELKDANGNAVGDLTGGDFALSGLGDASADPVTETATTGTYEAALTNTTAEQITVEVAATGTPLDDTPSITFEPGPVSAGASSVAATSPHAADGADASTVTIALADAQNNPIGGLGDGDFAVGLTGSASAGTVSETATAGTYTVGVTDATAEDVTVTVTARGTTLDDTPTVTFEAGPAARVAFVTEPATTTAGQAIDGPPTVRVTDANDNPVGGVNVTVAEGGGYTFDGGTRTQATDASGTATFGDLLIETAATGYRLDASIDGSDAGVATSATAQSAPFEVTAASAAALAYGQQPTGTGVDQALDPPVTVRIEDAYGNLTASTAEVTLALDADPSGGTATLGGTLGVAAVDGVATFDALTVDVAGAGYSLLASADGAGTRSSASFDVVGDTAPPASLTLDRPTATVVRALGDNGGRSDLDVTYSYDEPNPDTTIIVLRDGSGNAARFGVDDSGYPGDNSEKTVTLDLGTPDQSIGAGLEDGGLYDILVEATDRHGNAAEADGADLVQIDDTPPLPASLLEVNTVVFNGLASDSLYSRPPSATLDNLQEMTLELWLWPGSLPDTYLLAEKGGSGATDRQFRVYGDSNTVHVDLFTSAGDTVSLTGEDFFKLDATAATQAKDGSTRFEWAHLAVSVGQGGGTAALYRNGTVLDRVDIPGTLKTGSSLLNLGTGFDGEMHEIRVWATQRTQGEIQSTLTRTLADDTPSLVEYHLFRNEDRDASVARDRTANDNDLFLSASVERALRTLSVPRPELPEDTEYIIGFKDRDKSGGDVTARITSTPSDGTLYQMAEGATTPGAKITGPTTVSDPNNRVFYKPAADYNGPDAVGYELEDRTGNRARATTEIEVTPVNDAPRLSASARAPLSFEGTVRLDFAEFTDDVDHPVSELQWTASSAIDGLTVRADNDANQLVLTSPEGFLAKNENLPVEITVRDPENAEDVDTLRVTPTGLSAEYELGPNYPNPVVDNTSFEYSVPTQSEVTIRLYDLLGRTVATLVDGTVRRGVHRVQLDAGTQGLSSGTYFYRMEAESLSDNRRFSDLLRLVIVR